MSEVYEKENKDKKWNEADHYFLIKDVKIIFDDGYETVINLALTERELIEAIKRAKRNPEDFEDIDVTLIDKIKNLF